MDSQQWKVVYRYRNGVRTIHYATGFIPLRRLIQFARTIPGIYVVEAGLKIGPTITTFGITR